MVLCSYPCSPCSSSWLLTEMETCLCPCFGLGSGLSAEFMASARFIRPVTLQHFMSLWEQSSPPTLSLGIFIKMYLKRNSKFVEIALMGSICCVELFSLHAFSSASSHIKPQDRIRIYWCVN